MAFQTVDALQKFLADTVFQHTVDRKKAAGRALGTLVEIVTYYTLLAWDLRDNIVIERSVPEFANPEIHHNVEFSIHPILAQHKVEITPVSLPITAAKIKRQLTFLQGLDIKSTQVFGNDSVKRNSAVLRESERGPTVANLDMLSDQSCEITVCELSADPFAIFECKRVGIEEGMKKGPQTIEKAKQGAYVARSVSSLQKVRLRNGQFQGIIENPDGSFKTGPYKTVLQEIIDAPSITDIAGFILTIGVVSNHGNWFSSDNQNKELRVLAQSYDWLLFLTDNGLSQFIEELITKPAPKYQSVRKAFIGSYTETPRRNRFTKVRIDRGADEALRNYFTIHKTGIASWFNVISPQGGTLKTLQNDLNKLATKNQQEGD